MCIVINYQCVISFYPNELYILWQNAHLSVGYNAFAKKIPPEQSPSLMVTHLSVPKHTHAFIHPQDIASFGVSKM